MTAKELLTLGLGRLRSLGVSATGEVISGEPAPVIGFAARRFGADLVVVVTAARDFSTDGGRDPPAPTSSTM